MEALLLSTMLSARRVRCLLAASESQPTSLASSQASPKRGMRGDENGVLPLTIFLALLGSR